MRAWVVLVVLLGGCRTEGLLPADPCVAVPEPCGAHAQCRSTGDFYTCICDQGFVGDGHGCQELGDAGVPTSDGSDGMVMADSEMSLSVGDAHSCALGGLGQLWCWGASSATGTGSALASVATEVGTLDTNTLFADWTSVVAGHTRTCGLRRDGSLWCWGNVPKPEGHPTDRWQSVGVGAQHLCAIKTDGTLYCWGHNDGTLQQLGLGLTATVNVDAPTQVGSDSTWRTVSAYQDHTCALRTDGSLWCWGENFGIVAQYQNGHPVNSAPPTQLGAWQDWRSVHVGATHTCATRASGALYCWSYGGYYYGTGSSMPSSSPQAVAGNAAWKSFSAGGFGSMCGVQKDGTLWCLGGVVLQTSAAPPIQIGSDADWATVALSNGHGCAQKNDRRVFCWGQNNQGQLGNGRGPEVHAPGVVGARGTPAISDWEELSVGASTACGLRAGGTIWCWGQSASGNLDVPTQLGSVAGWSQLAVSSWQSCALSSGALYCWGDNFVGEVGDGTTTPRSTPTRVGTDDDWERVVVTNARSCGLRHGGQLSCWGAGNFGGLGTGSVDDAHQPMPVGPSTSRWSDVSIGGNYGCALRTDGALFCWGLLGNDLTSATLIPVQVGTATDWESIRIGSGMACGRRPSSASRSGQLWCWGISWGDSLGDLPDRTFVAAPILLPGVDAAEVTIGHHHLCTRSHSAIRCWGENHAGQLGADQTVGNQAFITPLLPTASVEIAAGAYFSCARQSDGTVWCWGANDSGQLGNGGLHSVAPEVVVNTPL